MEQKTIPQQKKLSKRRFIPMLVLIGIATILCICKDYNTTIVIGFIKILQSQYRESLITLLGMVIGILHFYYVGRLNEQLPAGFIRIGTGLFSSIATAIGYSYMMNKGLNFAIGITNDFLEIKPYFINRGEIDYFPIALVTTFIIFCAGYLLWKLAEDFLYEIVNPSDEADPVQNNDAEEVKK